MQYGSQRHIDITQERLLFNKMILFSAKQDKVKEIEINSKVLMLKIWKTILGISYSKNLFKKIEVN